VAVDRRRFRRIQAPVYCRSAGLSFLAKNRAESIDLSMGGIRVYSDQDYSVGEFLRLELFVADGEPATFTAEVMWREALPAGGPARFDVGLKFHELDQAALQLLTSVLGPAE
jgi:c-di-GMP-binding flagellar brake protein YcgR